MFEKHHKKHMMHHHKMVHHLYKKHGRAHHMKHHELGHHKIHPYGHQLPHEMHEFGIHSKHPMGPHHHDIDLHKMHKMGPHHPFGHHHMHPRLHHHPKHHHNSSSSSSDDDILTEGICNIHVDDNDDSKKKADNIQQAVEKNDINCQWKLKLRELKKNNKKEKKNKRHWEKGPCKHCRISVAKSMSEERNEMSASGSDLELPRKGHKKRENINLFMWSIAEQLKSLAPEKIAQAKLKILEIVNELQLTALQVPAVVEDIPANISLPVESQPTNG